jgi:hypothetical protein
LSIKLKWSQTSDFRNDKFPRASKLCQIKPLSQTTFLSKTPLPHSFPQKASFFPMSFAGEVIPYLNAAAALVQKIPGFRHSKTQILLLTNAVLSTDQENSYSAMSALLGLLKAEHAYEAALCAMSEYQLGRAYAALPNDKKSVLHRSMALVAKDELADAHDSRGLPCIEGFRFVAIPVNKRDVFEVCLSNFQVAADLCPVSDTSTRNLLDLHNARYGIEGFRFYDDTSTALWLRAELSKFLSALSNCDARENGAFDTVILAMKDFTSARTGTREVVRGGACSDIFMPCMIQFMMLAKHIRTYSSDPRLSAESPSKILVDASLSTAQKHRPRVVFPLPTRDNFYGVLAALYVQSTPHGRGIDVRERDTFERLERLFKEGQHFPDYIPFTRIPEFLQPGTSSGIGSTAKVVIGEKMYVSFFHVITAAMLAVIKFELLYAKAFRGEHVRVTNSLAGEVGATFRVGIQNILSSTNQHIVSGAMFRHPVFMKDNKTLSEMINVRMSEPEPEDHFMLLPAVCVSLKENEAASRANHAASSREDIYSVLDPSTK